MGRQAEVPEFEDRVRSGGDGRRSRSGGLKLVFLGAIAPVALAGAVVGGMLLVNMAAQDRAGEALDCGSSRDSWRWACQQAQSGEGYGINLASSDPAATTGSLERPVTGRATSAKGPDGEPVRASDAAAPSSAKEAIGDRTAAADGAKPVPKASDKVPEAKPSRSAWADPEPTKPAAATSPAVATPQPAATASAKPSEPARKAPVLVEMDDDEAPQPKPPTQATKSVSSPAPVAVVAEAPQPRATARVNPPAPTPVVERDEPPRKPAVAEAPEKPEAAPKRTVEERKAKSRKSIAQRRAAKRERLARSAPRGHRQDFDAATSYRVMSLRTYTLPDGRRVVVETAPRQEIVRELLSEHRATFGRQRFASPYDQW
jgi:hypothetical protein